jgi:hypothetical protein
VITVAQPRAIGHFRALAAGPHLFRNYFEFKKKEKEKKFNLHISKI